MFDTIENCTTLPSAAHELSTYLNDHHEALCNAAALLGGQTGVRLAQSIFDGLNDQSFICRRTMMALDNLIDLLMLEHVEDLERAEAAHFAAIDPASPVVEEICLLADSLHSVISAYHQTHNIVQQVAA